MPMAITTSLQASQQSMPVSQSGSGQGFNTVLVQAAGADASRSLNGGGAASEAHRILLAATGVFIPGSTQGIDLTPLPSTPWDFPGWPMDEQIQLTLSYNHLMEGGGRLTAGMTPDRFVHLVEVITANISAEERIPDIAFSLFGPLSAINEPLFMLTVDLKDTQGVKLIGNMINSTFFNNTDWDKSMPLPDEMTFLDPRVEQLYKTYVDVNQSGKPMGKERYLIHMFDLYHVYSNAVDSGQYPGAESRFLDLGAFIETMPPELLP